jgi:tol-pal system protein YbgF
MKIIHASEKVLLSLLSLIFISGCLVTVDEFNALQRQTVQLQTEIRNSQTSFTNEAGQLKSSTSRLDELHEKLRKSFADANARIDELDRNINKIKGETENANRETVRVIQNISEILKTQNEALKNIKLELTKNSEDLQNTKFQMAAFSNITSGLSQLKTYRVLPREKKELTLKEKTELYESALNFHKNKEYPKSIEVFESFLLLFPADPLSGNALYWIGESYYSQEKFRDALSYFHRIITDFPNSNKVAPALLKESYCLEELEMRKEAKAAMTELTVRFPYSDEAKQAAKKLKNKKP